MFDYSKDMFSKKERIEIVFKEYDTLRSELVARTMGGYQLVGIIALLASGLFAATTASWHPKILLGGIVVLLTASGFFFFYSFRDINLIARRLAEIESEINTSVEGEPVLQWESRFGASQGGWLARKTRKPQEPDK